MTWPSSSRMILSTRAELFVPSVLLGRCKVITVTEISSIHQEKPTEHFVTYREILVQPFSWQTFGWSNGNILAVAGRSGALRVGWFLAPQSRWNSLWAAGQGKSLSLTLSFPPKSPLRFLPWYSPPNSSFSNQKPSETVTLLRPVFLPFLSQHFTHPVFSDSQKFCFLDERSPSPSPLEDVASLPSDQHTRSWGALFFASLFYSGANPLTVWPGAVLPWGRVNQNHRSWVSQRKYLPFYLPRECRAV